LRERKRPSNGLKASFSLVNVAFGVYTLYLVVTPKMKEVALAFPPLPLGPFEFAESMTPRKIQQIP
jgi:hypothetical protein